VMNLEDLAVVQLSYGRPSSGHRSDPQSARAAVQPPRGHCTSSTAKAVPCVIVRDRDASQKTSQILRRSMKPEWENGV